MWRRLPRMIATQIFYCRTVDKFAMLYCFKCKEVFITKDNYELQMKERESWYCPYCKNIPCDFNFGYFQLPLAN